jgi:hypothetical protein
MHLESDKAALVNDQKCSTQLQRGKTSVLPEVYLLTQMVFRDYRSLKGLSAALIKCLNHWPQDGNDA